MVVKAYPLTVFHGSITYKNNQQSGSHHHADSPYQLATTTRTCPLPTTYITPAPLRPNRTRQPPTTHIPSLQGPLRMESPLHQQSLIRVYSLIHTHTTPRHDEPLFQPYRSPSNPLQHPRPLRARHTIDPAAQRWGRVELKRQWFFLGQRWGWPGIFKVTVSGWVLPLDKHWHYCKRWGDIHQVWKAQQFLSAFHLRLRIVEQQVRFSQSLRH